jgi:hypothetical protein
VGGGVGFGAGVDVGDAGEGTVFGNCADGEGDAFFFFELGGDLGITEREGDFAGAVKGLFRFGSANEVSQNAMKRSPPQKIP